MSPFRRLSCDIFLLMFELQLRTPIDKSIFLYTSESENYTIIAYQILLFLFVDKHLINYIITVLMKLQCVLHECICETCLDHTYNSFKLTEMLSTFLFFHAIWFKTIATHENSDRTLFLSGNSVLANSLILNMLYEISKECRLERWQSCCFHSSKQYDANVQRQCLIQFVCERVSVLVYENVSR